MCSKKKDLEIICNLQWKSKSNNGGVKSIIVGVYDVPNTTLSWELFKSYMLKNSGIPGDDVKVSFLATNDKEFPIESQMDYQIALYAFRKKARNGEIINLKLDRISEQHKLAKKITSSDVQTQFDNDGGAYAISPMSSLDTPPQWFTEYMKQFKKDIISEVSTTVSNYVSTIKSHGVQSYHSRKSKAETSKRSRKHPLIMCDVGNEKEFLKTLKLEKKVETKLEKLEGKSKKLKEKKLSLLTKSSDSDAGQSSSKSNSDTVLSLDMNQMNAAPVRNQQSVIPHMMGGEIYLHTWDVINNGLMPWTSDTELHFTWGSVCLEPVERIVPCPPLKAGETGSISVLLNVPNNCGQYESYWHFHHKGHKFGRWLGCQIIVDRINSAEPLANSFLDSYENLKTKYELNIFKTSPQTKVRVAENGDSNERKSTMVFQASEGVRFEKKANICQQIKVMNFPKNSVNRNIVTDRKPAQTNVDTPEISEIEEKVKSLEKAETSSSSENDEKETKGKTEEFIFVTRAPCTNDNVEKEEPTSPPSAEIEEVVLDASPSKIQIVEKFLNNEPQQPNDTGLDNVEKDSKTIAQKLFDSALESDDNNNTTDGAQDSSSESIGKIDEDVASNSTLNDMVMVNFGDEMEDHDTGFAYVMVDGTKVPIPKKYLRSDFLETAEDAPTPVLTDNVEVTSTGSVAQENTPDFRKTQDAVSSTINVEEIPNSQPSASRYQKPFDSESKPKADEVTYSSLAKEAFKINESVYYSPSMTTSTGGNSMIDQKGDSRKFVFPLNFPGYEVFPHQLEEASEPSCDNPDTRYSFVNDGGHNSQYMKTNIHSQGPSDVNIHYQYLHHQPVFTNAPSQLNPVYGGIPPAFNAYPNQSYANNVNSYTFIPNYQQTPPEQRQQLLKEQENVQPEVIDAQTSSNSSSYSFTCTSGNTYTAKGKEEAVSSQKAALAPSAPAHVSSVVTGAMTMASSALNTAKNVVNMIIPPRNENEPGGIWVDGHWVVTNHNSAREANLQALAEMGFWDRDLNATLLARYNDDIPQVVAELIQ